MSAPFVPRSGEFPREGTPSPPEPAGAVVPDLVLTWDVDAGRRGTCAGAGNGGSWIDGTADALGTADGGWSAAASWTGSALGDGKTLRPRDARTENAPMATNRASVAKAARLRERADGAGATRCFAETPSAGAHRCFCASLAHGRSATPSACTDEKRFWGSRCIARNTTWLNSGERSGSIVLGGGTLDETMACISAYGLFPAKGLVPVEHS